jgi:hypothetical protein
VDEVKRDCSGLEGKKPFPDSVTFMTNFCIYLDFGILGWCCFQRKISQYSDPRGRASACMIFYLEYRNDLLTMWCMHKGLS